MRDLDYHDHEGTGTSGLLLASHVADVASSQFRANGRRCFSIEQRSRGGYEQHDNTDSLFNSAGIYISAGYGTTHSAHKI